MIVAVLGDVHANIPAWKAVLADLRARQATVVWALGDWLGYGDSDLIALWYKLCKADGPPASRPPFRSVLGNHDLAIMAKEQAWKDLVVQLKTRAQDSLGRQREEIEGDPVWLDRFRPWLASLPYILSPRPGVYLAHGAFPMISGVEYATQWYVPDRVPHEDVWRELQRWLGDAPPVCTELVRCVGEGWADPRLLVTGHTHKQAVWQRNGESNGLWPEIPNSRVPYSLLQEGRAGMEPIGWEVELNPNPDEPVWMNPGSVGTRNLTAGVAWAHYALLNWHLTGSDTGILLEWRCVPYEAGRKE